MVRKKKSNFEKSALRTERTGTFEGAMWMNFRPKSGGIII